METLIFLALLAYLVRFIAMRTIFKKTAPTVTPFAWPSDQPMHHPEDLVASLPVKGVRSDLFAWPEDNGTSYPEDIVGSRL